MQTTTDTRAAYYLHADGFAPYGRRDWLREYKRSGRFRPYMVYVGEGYVPLQVAVLARSGDEALQAAVEYLSEHRPEEVSDDDVTLHVLSIGLEAVLDALAQYK